MKKRLKMLLAVVMLIALLVPATAMAARGTCNHSCGTNAVYTGTVQRQIGTYSKQFHNPVTGKDEWRPYVVYGRYNQYDDRCKTAMRNLVAMRIRYLHVRARHIRISEDV